ncbi:hypothetical protein Stube_61020 [Streptomyces tubercidicus]|uniref:Uncharacterized protein n=1 Tax=Streptomyces tubercidicus TaxID=47759 RepID=A0A640UZT4_9ACTN|nr:hypothetical protein Stube_61020 [Streptomyces tubercidicus]
MNAHMDVRDTNGTSSNATIFRRTDFPRKRMASPTSTPAHGVVFRQQTARAYYCRVTEPKCSSEVGAGAGEKSSRIVR